MTRQQQVSGQGQLPLRLGHPKSKGQIKGKNETYLEGAHNDTGADMGGQISETLLQLKNDVEANVEGEISLGLVVALKIRGDPVSLKKGSKEDDKEAVLETHSTEYLSKALASDVLDVSKHMGCNATALWNSSA